MRPINAAATHHGSRLSRGLSLGRAQRRPEGSAGMTAEGWLAMSASSPHAPHAPVSDCARAIRPIACAAMPIWSLYTTTVIVWGLSWHAMLYQTGVAPELSIAYRFLLAAALMVVFCVVTRRRLLYRPRDYALMLALGLFLFCTNYILFYYAAGYLATGLLAVVFCMITVLNMVNAALLFEQK